MKTLTYLFYNYLYKPVLKLYLRSDTRVQYDDFELTILKGVFHPKLFFSTTYLYSFISQQSFTSLQFLEIGSGSGILSLLAKKKGAIVTAIDNDPIAVENTRLNFITNFGTEHLAKILKSDVFENLFLQKYNVIVINPPYYFKKIESNSQMAWYCGENGEYFEKLFSGLAAHMHPAAQVYMVLEEKCEIERIKTMASNYKIIFLLRDQKLIRWERSYIYQLFAQ
ncbi:MAG: methyltransferase [bacterium]|nr:methyltransferase [bacterium]